MKPTRIPRRGESVRIAAHQDEFLVVRVDKVHNIATVERWDDPTVSLWDVPFDAIHLVPETIAA
jgi:hypothetical protein